jgi:hypothetical protein
MCTGWPLECVTLNFVPAATHFPPGVQYQAITLPPLPPALPDHPPCPSSQQQGHFPAAFGHLRWFPPLLGCGRQNSFLIVLRRAECSQLLFTHAPQPATAAAEGFPCDVIRASSRNPHHSPPPLYICVYVCVCMYVCVYVYLYIYMYACAATRFRLCLLSAVKYHVVIAILATIFVSAIKLTCRLPGMAWPISWVYCSNCSARWRPVVTHHHHHHEMRALVEIRLHAKHECDPMCASKP